MTISVNKLIGQLPQHGGHVEQGHHLTWGLLEVQECERLTSQSVMKPLPLLQQPHAQDHPQILRVVITHTYQAL